MKLHPFSFTSVCTVKTFGLLQPHFRFSELHQCDQGMLPNRFLESSLRSIFSSIICFERMSLYTGMVYNETAMLSRNFHQLEKQF